MRNKYSCVFDKGSSSLFIISSPLQLLCAIEAIREFRIANYLVLFVAPSNSIRNVQVINMLSYYKIAYKFVEVPDSYSIYNKILKSFFSKSPSFFSRIFVGDYNNLFQLAIALQYHSLSSHVLYLDDGTANIAVLQNVKIDIPFKQRLARMIISFLFLLKFTNINKYFYTLYHDLVTSKILYPNNFSHLIKSTEANRENNGVFFIGTNSLRYTECYLNNDFELYKSRLFDVLLSIKENNPSEVVYYIPHGRDSINCIETFCMDNGIVYLRLEEAVESYFAKSTIYPKLIAGFVSSALFNLKKMFPKSDVINYYPVSKQSSWYEKFYTTSLYYEKHGIEFNLILA